ncbi:MAG: NUDIX domain-containing protein [Candidatus Paceibacterota bacterium]|nr:NUDIX domain-containing protein [Candidatus Paceibacterota bacterium]
MNKYKKEIEICVRGLIRNKGNILVCWNKKKKYYFFPGGHVEFGETLENALKRELKEELDITVLKLRFIGAVENIFEEDKEKHYEINFIFDVLTKTQKNKSKENHIDFFFLNKEEFSKRKVLPFSMKKSVIKWMEDKKPFFINKK